MVVSSWLSRVLPSVALLVLLVAPGVSAQVSSVAAAGSAQNGSWVVRTGPDARIEAITDCNRGAGGGCEIVVECGFNNVGYGALARGRTQDGRIVFGGSCGESTQEAAISRAINRCRFNNGTGCTIESDWNTDQPQGRVGVPG